VYIILIAFLLMGCAPYKVPTTAVQQNEETPHWLYNIIPRHRCQIKWYDLGHWTTWALLGNDDGGIFGEDDPNPYHPCTPNSCRKALCWCARNPLHNFCYYLIGSAYCQNSELTLVEISRERRAVLTYYPLAWRNFASEDGAGFLVALHGWKPYVSLRLLYTPKYKGDFYFGWRDRGNFGIKFVPWTRTGEKCYP